MFNIIPMYNPDGVELGYGRENANGVDIESNWDKPVLEPEVQVLKGLFEKFMAEPNPTLPAPAHATSCTTTLQGLPRSTLNWNKST